MVPTSRLKGLSPVFWRPGTSTRYVYSVGLFRTYADVLGNLNKVKKLGFKGAFIVAFLDGKPIPVQKARQSEKQYRQVYHILITPSDGNPLSDTAATTIHALTGKEIARITDQGTIAYIIGPFDDVNEANVTIKSLKNAISGNITLETSAQ